MTDLFLPLGDGHTELTDEDRLGLIPTYISTRGELFEAEQANIAQAMLRRRPSVHQLLDDKYLRDLHRAMFGDVWRWAGQYRSRETNIGSDPTEIGPATRVLVDDVRAWIAYETYELDELAVRYHHRLVAIHPFPNGNGRFSRIASDHLVARLGGDPFTWGAGLSLGTERLRARYRAALQSADDGDVTALVAFARE